MLHAGLSPGGVQVVALPESLTVAAAIERYGRQDWVQFVEPDYVRHLALLPDDPSFRDGTLWGLHNEGQAGGTVDADIDAPEAWDILTSASNIVVAVLDTGIRPTHEDLVGNIWTNKESTGFGWNALTGTPWPVDDEGHGTLVAGILGAVGNNGKGVAGVAWRVQIMSCKCFNGQRLGYDSDIIACIDFARTNGARIINASLGAYAYSQALSNAVFAAREAGILFVAACGNDGRDIDANPYYPASYDMDNVISVGFTGRSDELGAQSNYGVTNVDLAAPGAALRSTFYLGNNSYLGGSFLFGTSLAAPYVSGALALALARYPDDSHAQTRQRLLETVDNLPALASKCSSSGRLNVRTLLSGRAPALEAVFRSGELQLLVRCAANGKVAIETTQDLEHWQPLCSGEADNEGRFRFATQIQEGTQKAFFRALTDR